MCDRALLIATFNYQLILCLICVVLHCVKPMETKDPLKDFSALCLSGRCSLGHAIAAENKLMFCHCRIYPEDSERTQERKGKGKRKGNREWISKGGKKGMEENNV